MGGKHGYSPRCPSSTQTTILRHILSHLLEHDEDWEAAAKVMIGIPLENTARLISDQQKFDVYMKIVRLLIEVSGILNPSPPHRSRGWLLIDDSFRMKIDRHKKQVKRKRISQERVC